MKDKAQSDATGANKTQDQSAMSSGSGANNIKALKKTSGIVLLSVIFIKAITLHCINECTKPSNCKEQVKWQKLT